MTTKIFTSGVAVFIVLAVLFLYGYQQNFFQTLIWWDILMHFLGGIWAGYIGAWFISFLGYPVRMSHFVAGAILLGLAVEVVEYFFVIGRNPFMSYELDTSKDIFVDVIGGVAAGLSLTANRS